MRTSVEAATASRSVPATSPEWSSGTTSVEHARESLRDRPIADYRKHGFGRLACIDLASGRLIGFAGLKYLEDLGEVDLGYRLLPDFWGRGLATEAAQAVLDHGFVGRKGVKARRMFVDELDHLGSRVLQPLGIIGRQRLAGMAIRPKVLDLVLHLAAGRAGSRPWAGILSPGQAR